MFSSTQDAIRKYQAVYQKDPLSKIFAPLAEAYRKSGQLEYAFSIALKGVKSHPEFASGRVTLARVFMEQKQWDKAIEQLKLAADLNPEILLAHKLLGESYLELRQISKALQAYKMALYLDPLDEKAKAMVKKLESLNYQEEEAEQSLQAANKHMVVEADERRPPLVQKTMDFEMDRKTSLIDAFISRRDFGRAMECIEEAIEQVGKDPQILRRKRYVEKRFQNDGSAFSEIKDNASVGKKINKLRKLQSRIEKRRIFTPKTEAK